MKASKYTYKVELGEEIIFFNGISERYFAIPKTRLAIYESILNNPEAYREQIPDFIEKMIVDNFIVNDENHDLQLVEEKYNRLCAPDVYQLMILPTYECNLRCWYCTQKHADLWLSEESKSKIKQRIIHKLENEEIKHFQLTWFGGEPLLNYDAVIELTTYGKNEAEKRGKTFTSSITTNGTLLTEERIEELRQLGVASYQITIDGDKATHDTVKVLGNISAFDRTMKNIDTIARHTKVIFRFNYTADNLKPKEIMEDVVQRLSPESRQRIVFFITKVWQEDANAVDDSKVEELINLAKEAGIRVDMNNFGLCYTEQKHFDCVFPTGKFGMCDNLDPEDMTGEIEPDGTLTWHDDQEYRKNAFNRKDSMCQQCSFLPMCWGPCISKRQTNEAYRDIKICVLEDKEQSIKNLARNCYLCSKR